MNSAIRSAPAGEPDERVDARLGVELGRELCRAYVPALCRPRYRRPEARGQERRD
jgi:hypothetical protein